MTLKEWWEQNQDKEVRIKEDGSISITKKGDRWTPKLEDRYWIVTHDGGSEWSTWEDDYTDKNRYAIGNIFETKEEADKTVEILKIRAQLKACGGKEAREVILPVGNIYKYRYAIAINSNHSAVPISTLQPRPFEITFETEAEVEAAIHKVGEDRIKKYLFGIED